MDNSLSQRLPASPSTRLKILEFKISLEKFINMPGRPLVLIRDFVFPQENSACSWRCSEMHVRIQIYRGEVQGLVWYAEISLLSLCFLVALVIRAQYYFSSNSPQVSPSYLPHSPPRVPQSPSVCSCLLTEATSSSSKLELPRFPAP